MGRLSWYHGACVYVALILLKNGPKIQDSDGGNSEVPKRSRQVLLLSDKVEVLDLGKLT